MSTGYSGTPLIRKLGIKPGFRALVVDPPDRYRALLGELPEAATLEEARLGDLQRRGAGGTAAEPRPFDFVHLFATRPSALERALRHYRAAIAPDGMIWASWPKRASGVATELDGSLVRRTGLAAGLVDIKVCAVDETWSGLKFVIRLADRPREGS